MRSLHNEVFLKQCKYLIKFSRVKFFYTDKTVPKRCIFNVARAVFKCLDEKSAKKKHLNAMVKLYEDDSSQSPWEKSSTESKYIESLKMKHRAKSTDRFTLLDAS